MINNGDVYNTRHLYIDLKTSMPNVQWLMECIQNIIF